MILKILQDRCSLNFFVWVDIKNEHRYPYMVKRWLKLEYICTCIIFLSFYLIPALTMPTSLVWTKPIKNKKKSNAGDAIDKYLILLHTYTKLLKIYEIKYQ